MYQGIDREPLRQLDVPKQNLCQAAIPKVHQYSLLLRFRKQRDLSTLSNQNSQVVLQAYTDESPITQRTRIAMTPTYLNSSSSFYQTNRTRDQDEDASLIFQRQKLVKKEQQPLKPILKQHHIGRDTLHNEDLIGQLRQSISSARITTTERRQLSFR